MRFLVRCRWNHVAMEQAIRDAGLGPAEVSNERTGIIMVRVDLDPRHREAADTARSKGPKRVGPFAVPKTMSSTASHARHLVQDQRRELFDLIRLRDLQSLHRNPQRSSNAAAKT